MTIRQLSRIPIATVLCLPDPDWWFPILETRLQVWRDYLGAPYKEEV